MQSTNPVVAKLWEWTEISMRGSMHHFMALAKENGMSMSQIMTLFRIQHKGARGVSDIGDELGITSAASSQMLERLVQQGLITRSEDPQDRRMKQIVLTDKGNEKICASIKARQEWMENLIATLSPAEQEQVLQTFQILVERAHQLEAASQT
jgi:DNA-binding MarR family transcriptional regulator